MSHRRPNRLLQGMFEIEIGLGGEAAQTTVGEHTRVLARAVVVQGGELHVRGRYLIVRRVEHRRMDPALQICGRAADAFQHVGHRRHVPWLAGMAGAEQSHLLARESEPIRASAGYERQGLQRLQRAAGRREVMRVAGSEDQLPTGVDHCDRAEVHAVDRVTSGNDGKRDVRRGRATRVRQGPGDRAGKRLFYRARSPRASRVRLLASAASASRICSSAPGSSMVVRSPGSRPSASA